jgi:Uma2 family endonuclease
MADLTQIQMTAEEFFALPESNLPAELIEGELVVSPTPKDGHQNVVLSTAVYLKHKAITGQVKIAPLDVYFDNINITQPDVFWVSAANTTCKLGDDGYWYGPPDLIVEVLSPGTQHRDRGAKFRLYQRYGVREYWLVDPIEQYIEVFVLQDGAFIQQGLYTPGDTFASPALDGQTIDVKALFES